MKILVVFGTRPEAIKMAPLVHAFQADAHFQTQVCVTAQHREMLDQVLGLFNIAPDYDLNLMRPGQDLYDVTSSVLLGMRDVLHQAAPDAVLVHGDTTTAAASAIAAFYAGIPIGHIEAGLRTHDIRSPFPEEFNRQLVSKLARWHFAPTKSSRNNLLTEGILDSTICVTGNTVIDALFWTLKRLDQDNERRKDLQSRLATDLSFDWQAIPFVLITGHRRENFGDGFLAICAAISELAAKHPETHFVYPVHLNPNVRKPVFELIADARNIHLIEPLEYEPFVYLLKHCHLVLTDSGGLQEEAPSLGKPVLVMRDVTERPEAVDAGTVKLVGANKENIVRELSRLLTDIPAYEKMSLAHNPYGDGHATLRILKYLKNT
jgi:UDP-N-acetylglucosamine 2-epimerase (non-hydrolysing)